MRRTWKAPLGRAKKQPGVQKCNRCTWYQESVTRRRLGYSLAIITVVLILLALTPWRTLQDHPHWEKVGWIPFVSPPVRPRDILRNALLFAPLGVGIALITRNKTVLRTALLAFALSIGGELLQLYSHSRFPSMTDVTVNVAASTAAAMIVRRLFEDSLPKDRETPR
jgi:glycopeptide antibiotics resistance protein